MNDSKYQVKAFLSNAAKAALTSAVDYANRDKAYLELEKAKQTQALSNYTTNKRLVKAALIPRPGEGNEADIIRFMFNPSDLQYSRNVEIAKMDGARTSRGLPKVNFGFIEPYRLKLSGLVFDTYEIGTSVIPLIQPILNAVDFTHFRDPFTKDEEYQERVVGLTEVVAPGSEKVVNQAVELRRPPVYYFMWGDQKPLRCMVKDINYKLTMFLPSGTPVRAMVDLTLEEVDLGVASREFSARQKFIK